MFNVLTPLLRGHRVTRKVNPDSFFLIPGKWAALASDGSVVNVTAGSPALVNKLVLGNASSSSYESHDVKVRRVTTLETPGMRCEGNASVLVLTNLALGSVLVVSTETGSEGKLAATTEVANGTYEVVARVVDIVGTDVTYILESPYSIDVANPTTIAPTTAAPGTTVTPTTIAPVTTIAPTTVAPVTTVAPTTVAPVTTISPTTIAPTTAAPTSSPTTVAPTTIAPTTVAPTTVAPTTVAPTTVAPTTVAPTTVAPTTIAPTTAAPTTAPTTIAPTTIAPTTVAPTTAPTTAAPTTAPTTAAPTTAPTTVAPTPSTTAGP